MNVLFCSIPLEHQTLSLGALWGGPHGHVGVADATAAVRAMEGRSWDVIAVGGPTPEAIADACRLVRESEPSRAAFILAAGTEDTPAVRALIEAGANDVFVDTPGGESLQSHLLVAQRTAAGLRTGMAAQQEREQFFQLSLQLLCIAGLDGYLKVLNPAWTHTLGWSARELQSKPWLDFVHPDDYAATVAAGARLSAGAEVVNFSNRYRSKEGGYRWLQWQCASDVERGIIYATAQDITEAIVIATDLDGNVVRINPVAEQLTGWTLTEAAGRPLREVLPRAGAGSGSPTEAPTGCAHRGAAAPTLITRPDGSELAIEERSSPIRSADGKFSGAVLVFRDLTAERHAKAAEARFQNQLILSDRMASVGTLAAGVAHEINNPLSYTAANVETAIEEVRALSGGSASGRMKELEQMLLESREGLARVAKIVRGLKTFSRIEEERPAVIEIGPVIELAINMAFNELRHRARLVKEFGKLPYVEADDARLGQVFINLLVNAAHSFPEANTEVNEVRIVTSTDGEGRAVVEIRDNGSGIEKAIQSRIFDPFFTTKPAGIGTGLGLAISHNIVTGMGGEISVDSEPGGGTSFRVVLPPARRQELTDSVVRQDPKAPAPRSASVLVVDDEPAIGLALRRVLRQHQVTVLTRGEDALALLASGKSFDVILSDLMMPGMSGMEFYRALVKSHPKLASRVVFLTGGAFTPEANAFLDSVGNERMEKPFDSGALRSLIQKFLK
jgi:PAS domain S-box-containing protein